MKPADRRHRERGVAMVLAVLFLVVVGAFLALSLNTGHGVAVRGELQNSVDSSALAGVRELDGSLASITSAANVATDFAGRHVTDSSITVVPNLVEFGNFDPATRTWTPFGTAATINPATLYLVNAIHVVAARQAGQPGGGALTAYFGNAFLNRSQFDVVTEAIAYAGSPCPVDGVCDSPFVVRYGCLYDSSPDLKCDQDYNVGLSNATTDAIGFSDMNPQSDITGNPSANTPAICQGVMNPQPVTCTMGMSELRTSNGTQLGSNCPGGGGLTLCQLIQQRYQPPNNTMRIPVITYPGDSVTSCLGGQYNGVAQIVSTMKVRVDGVWCGTSGESVRTGACAGYSTGQCISIHTLCDDSAPTPGSCVQLGLTTATPALGR